MTQLKQKEAEITVLREQLQRKSSNDPTTQLTNGTSEKHKKTVHTPICCTTFYMTACIQLKIGEWKVYGQNLGLLAVSHLLHESGVQM